MPGDKRAHVRTELPASVKLIHPDIGEVTLRTRDVSGGGVYVLCNDPSLLPVGSVVKVQVVSEHADMPIVDAQVIRKDSEGMGMEFITK